MCPFNTSWARGKIVKSSIQQSDIVDHVESVKHKQGVMMYTQKPIVEGLCAMTKQACERAEYDAETSSTSRYASWPVHVAKVAHK